MDEDSIYNEATEGMLANEGGPFGAVIIQDGKVIAAAHNEVLKTNEPTAMLKSMPSGEPVNSLSTIIYLTVSCIPVM